MRSENIVFKSNLPVYIQLISKLLANDDSFCISVNDALERLDFKLPKGLTKKEIQKVGEFPVVSQSKELIVGYSDSKDELIDDALPLIVYGDHSKTIKYVDFPFIVGADGVKLLKPKCVFYPKYFYYSLIGLETDTKNYGRHFGFLKEKKIIAPNSIHKQKKIVEFVEDIKNRCVNKKEYFSRDIEEKIKRLHINGVEIFEICSELAHQQTLLKKLRQQILQEAIKGELTADWRTQNPNIEPASALLERIRAEKERLIEAGKMKRQKPLPPISEKEKPFKLPEGWGWCRLGDLILMHYGKGLTKAQTKPAGKYPVYGSNGIVGFYDIGLTDKRSVIIGRKGSAGALQVALNGSWATDVSYYVEDSEYLDFQYMVYLLGYLQLSDMGKGIKPGLNRDEAYSLIAPITSSEEQKAIVAKVDKMLLLCDQLETQITQNQAHAKALMQAVLKEAFAHSD